MFCSNDEKKQMFDAISQVKIATRHLTSMEESLSAILNSALTVTPDSFASKATAPTDESVSPQESTAPMTHEKSPELLRCCGENEHCTEVRKTTFASLIPAPIGTDIDAIFEKEKWELQEWHKCDGIYYQVYFGTGVQVDNYYEYGFPYLYDIHQLTDFAWNFYRFRVCNQNREVQQ